MSSIFSVTMTTWPNQDAAANRRPAGQSDGSDNLSAIVAADRAFPAAVAEVGRYPAYGFASTSFHSAGRARRKRRARHPPK